LPRPGAAGYGRVMRLTVLGGCGGYPAAGQACSGYLVEYDGFRLLMDPGYAIVPRLLESTGAGEIDAVFVTHGHPDHCADLNPLLRARVMSADPPAPLPVYAPPDAVAAVLALDGPRTMARAYELHEFTPGSSLDIGPFQARTRLLPHWLPNAGIRLAAGGRALMYTGDSGPAAEVVELARDADLLLAEATHVDEIPEPARPYLTTAGQAGQQARAAGARQLVLTHLWPGTDPAVSRAAAGERYDGPIRVADAGLVLDL
jgi:ribonuclease BN (tRNA processing enzyme)